ncbi:disintegrin and metalloproteinase domain-containing protein mind-meld isoform X3 [Osmia lignaria lignaria]|uniref:disintegrin and metalloproteinase domain-containing protein mind-meld isoform X3 n=1 Tax=Osmia lignaria lignaria TaxID=1437193 RepID=UPI0014792799|nr:disintegrin and metalloproteinase domain-containing protein unc-71 isoform X3 [Osmia lignaria]
MFWLHCGLFVLVIAVPGFISSADSTSKREADYTLDDSFWNEETPSGEVERLLREYRQNQELVRNIGAHFYQIIYPVQLRHHEKMGISTREVSVSKFPQRGYGEGGYQNSRGRMKTGRHFHRTSLLIKAFNHKFRLDLELNTQLLAPNIMQKDYLADGVEQSSKQEIEHCYYHGTVRDYPGASAAFHTCNGVSGVIHLGNETFVIHPFYGGDLSQKHPHVIFEARTKANKGCANLGNLEWRAKSRRQKHVLGLSETPSDRYKRDVRETTKYIETAIIIDKAMFEKRNGSTRAEVVHDAIQVANIADLYFRTLNTRVSVTYIETWQSTNQADISKGMDISIALRNLNDYTVRRMYQVDEDTTQLLTGEIFAGGELGMAEYLTICKQKAVGISVDLNVYEPHLLAGTMAHMIGHNIGMAHDDRRSECICRDWHGCIMAQSIVGLENVQPYKFSECSKMDYIDSLRAGKGFCLLNKPNEVEMRTSCGNKVIDDDEECDCGSIDECPKIDPCCDPITCKLTSEAECASGPCCSNCKLLKRGVVCRDSTNECDLPEVCSGESGQCPVDVYKKNGIPCSNDQGYCFNGECPALDLQCDQIWGYGGVVADKQCFEQFNSKGSLTGHCGTDASGHYIKCEPENVRCGSLQCQQGSKQPVMGGMDHSRTIISIKGKEYECKSTTGKVEGSEMPRMGLVRDGTSCGDNLICVNQTCTSRFPLIDKEHCPSNHNNNECSGNGVCTNANKCYCYPGWSGPDCSIVQEIPTHPPTTSSTESSGKNSTDPKLVKKETPYENYHGSNTVFLVGMLMSVVGGVFIVFALMALCYRSVVVHKNYSLCLRRKSTVQKYDQPYGKKAPQKSYSENHRPEHAILDDVNKILTSNSMPNYSRSDNQRVVFRSPNNVTTADGPRLKDHRSQAKRLAINEVDAVTSAEEAVSFIDLPNHPTKKGILKKHPDYGIEGGTVVELERTLDRLNGYHEGIIEALRNAESHRELSGPPLVNRNLIDQEALHKPLSECSYPDPYRKGLDRQEHMENQADEEDEEEEEEEEDESMLPCGTIRIRNLEDIIKQLERHTTRNISRCNSDDIRMSESEADRHYRIDSSVCSESSQGSRRCSRARDDTYGRYCQPSSRSPYGTHQLVQHPHQMHKEEDIYETADPDRGSNTRGETPDSESDAFIQAQQQLARWTSEDGVQHRPPQQPPPPPPPPPPPAMTGGTVPLLQRRQSQRDYRQQQQQQHHHHHQSQPLQQQSSQQQHQHHQQEQQQQQHQLPVEQLPIQQRGYYPSPLHTDNGLDNDETENAQSHQKQMLPDVRGIDVNHLPNINKCPLDDNFSLDCNINNGSLKELNTNNTSDNENTALLPPSHFPEYKH